MDIALARLAQALAPRLSACTTIVAHKDCPDGKLSAYILARYLPGAEVVFVQYGTRDHLELAPKPGMVFCDITPVRERAGAFLEAGAFVLDHHDKQRDVTRLFVGSGLGIYAAESTHPAVSGAVLASWVTAYAREGDGDLKMGSVEVERDLSELAGVRDTWQREHKDFARACEQAHGLMFLPWASLKALHPSELALLLARLGPILAEQKRYFVSETIKKGYRGEVHVSDGRFAQFFVMQGIDTSDVAEALRQEDPPIDLAMGFEYFLDGVGKIRWSLRSRPGGPIRAADLAAHFGGGGHDHAAGFVMPVDVFMQRLLDAGRVPDTAYPPTLGGQLLTTFAEGRG